VDGFGNKELLYRDPAIPSLSPVPLRPRAVPLVIPDLTARQASGASCAPATVMVLNVYDADFEWPAKARISALRLIQLLPKTTPKKSNPRIGMAGDANARLVLGTVPVEADGSACFEVPVGKPLYFQALDERGLAVQSMRSVTYLHPGERLTCRGCHERKRSSPPSSNVPSAARRPASKLQPEAEGSNPFNYVRLVQPVLDRHCVACHQQKKGLDLTGAPGQTQFTRSYDTLASKYGFYFDSTKGCLGNWLHGGARTEAGKFGARAAPLFKLLEAGHHGLKLPPEDLHRLTLWLDCNSDFYGAYHGIEEQRKGLLVKPELE